MSLPLPLAGAFAQPGGWERHKRTIARLYMEEDKPLREVAEIMREEHNFKATAKMYKQRFRQWGFRKNLSSCEAKLFESQAVAGKTPSLPIIQGHKLGSKRLKSRAARTDKQTIAESNRGPLLMPILVRITAPDKFRLAEKSLGAVVMHSKARFDAWGVRDYTSKEHRYDLQNWSQKILLAAHNLAHKQDPVLNFRVINKSCDEYKAVLLQDDPRLIWLTMHAILSLAHVDDKLALSFLKLVAGTSAAYLGQSHPLTVLWANMLRINTNDMRQLVVPLIDAQLGFLYELKAPANVFVPSFVSGFAKNLNDLSLSSPQECLWRIDQNIQWMHRNPEIESSKPTLPGTYLLRACVCSDIKDYKAAEVNILEAELLLRNDDRPELKMQLVNCLEIKAEMLMHTGNFETSEMYYKESLATALQFLKETSPQRIGFSFAAFVNFYVASGNTEAADAVRLDEIKHLNSMVGETTSTLEEIK